MELAILESEATLASDSRQCRRMSKKTDDGATVPGIQLPQAGEQVFVAEGLFHETACVLSGSWWGHAVSYKETADIAVRHALNDTSSLDFVILPVCFLYRHYLELALKGLAHDAARALNKNPPKLDHDLMNRWRFILQAFPDQDASLAATTEHLDQWSQLDRDSFSFRYPTDKNGDPSLSFSIRHLNIRNIADLVERIDNVLSGMAGYLEDTIDG